MNTAAKKASRTTTGPVVTKSDGVTFTEVGGMVYVELDRKLSARMRQGAKKCGMTAEAFLMRALRELLPPVEAKVA